VKKHADSIVMYTEGSTFETSFHCVNLSNQFILSGYKRMLSLAELAGCTCANFILNDLQNAIP
jgi:hypothetical protein